MTLAASERSLLIRNKFRSVLQLRIQNRRQNEINADLGKSSSSLQKTEDEKSEALRLPDDSAIQKLPPSGVNVETAKERTHRHKKARQELAERVPRLSGSSEPQYELRLPLESLSSACFALPSDVFEDDISSCSSTSSPTEQLHQSAAFPSLPLLSGEQLLSDFSATSAARHHSPGHTQSGLALLPATEGIQHPLSVTLGDPGSMATGGGPNGMFLTCQTTPMLPKAARPPSPTCSSALPSLNFNHQPRPRKPRDTKPKMKKLKYHQYIPPDQRVAGTGAAAKPKSLTQSLDPAYSHLVKQQQVILQLQILQNQQQQQQQQQLQSPQITVVPSGEAADAVKSSGAMPLNPQPVPATTNHTPASSKAVPKPELLPANLVDLTVSELRQQLRKRGLPVSGTKPALLQRLRPFQLPVPCVAPAPLCPGASEIIQLPLSPNHSPVSSASSGSDSPSQCPSKHIYIQNRKIPNGILSEAPNGLLSDVPNAFTNATSVSLAGEQCTVFMGPAASTASGTPSPSLPMSSSSPLQCGAPWRTESEQQQQQQEELSVEMEMRERIKSRNRDHLTNANQQSYGTTLHPFLQQDPGCLIPKPKSDTPTEVLFTQVYSCQPCDAIGQDFELPVQITASPQQTSPAVRSLEEELQEAIQKAQMDPRQSIDDILDEPISCNDSMVPACDGRPPAAPSPSPLPPQSDLSQASQPQHKDEHFLPSPLCSSLLLEMPPSPAVIPPAGHMIPPLLPPPPPLCASPLSSRRRSRKRRAPPPFDAAEWLETLTCGLRPLTPPTAPFVEPDFSLDADLNVNRVLDLMIEQW